MNGPDDAAVTQETGRLLLVAYETASRLRLSIKLAREGGASERQIAGILGISQATLAKFAPVVPS